MVKNEAVDGRLLLLCQNLRLSPDHLVCPYDLPSDWSGNISLSVHHAVGYPKAHCSGLLLHIYALQHFSPSKLHVIDP